MYSNAECATSSGNGVSTWTNILSEKYLQCPKSRFVFIRQELRTV